MRISDWSSDVCSSDLLLLRSSQTRLNNSLTTAGMRQGSISAGRDTVVPVAGDGPAREPPSATWAARRARAGCKDSLHPLRAHRTLVPLATEIGRASCRERVCQYV